LNPTSRKYLEKILEQYWVPNPYDTKLGSIPIDNIIWTRREKERKL
jgi:hypothetical protein